VKRREFITLLGGATAWPLAARAQQPKVWHVGFLAPVPPTSAMLSAIRDGLRERGYVEGQNLSIDVRWSEGSFEQNPGLAADLIRSNVDVIVAWSSPAVFAAHWRCVGARGARAAEYDACDRIFDFYDMEPIKGARLKEGVMYYFATTIIAGIIAAVLVSGAALAPTPAEAAKLSNAERAALQRATVACKAEAKARKFSWHWLKRRKYVQNCIIRTVKGGISINIWQVHNKWQAAVRHGSSGANPVHVYPLEGDHLGPRLRRSAAAH